MTAPDPQVTIDPASREAWRDWLEQNHATASGIWVVLYKKDSSITGLRYEESVEEALCFGWIDSVTRRLDDTRLIQFFAPRKPDGTWARSNKLRVERLIAEGRMTPAGLAKIEAAKTNGSWNALDAIDDLLVPDDLAHALVASPVALANFNAFSPSSRKMILFWIASAKRPETRARRIAETARLAEQNIRARQ